MFILLELLTSIMSIVMVIFCLFIIWSFFINITRSDYKSPLDKILDTIRDISDNKKNNVFYCLVRILCNFLKGVIL